MATATQNDTTTKWSVDASHSQIGFRVKHMVISTVSGLFKTFNVDVETQGDDFSTAKVNVTIDTATVDTGNDQRDGHLKSDDFFNAEQFPQIKFVSDRVEQVNSERWHLHGNLTIRDITKPITLDVEFGGVVKDPWGMTRAGFAVSGSINRRDYNLRWNAAIETGGMVVSDDVRINCEVEIVKQQAQA
jgi:polyisoprenoid-binding protein YceI